MKKILLAGVAMTALVGGSAGAADLPAPPAYKAPPAQIAAASWTGCYGGIHGGWGWGTEHVSTHSILAGVITRSNETSIDTSGAILGGQLGCDYQFMGRFVIGIQGEYTKMRVVGDIQDPHDGSNTNDVLRFQTDRIATVTGRIGITGWGNQALLYLKGGGAWLNNKYDFRSADRFALRGVYEQSFSGWTIGGGIEWAFAPSVSVFLEYDHYDFGNGITTIAFRNFGGPFSEDYQVRAPRIDAFKFGVNYRFGLGLAGF